MKRKLLSDVLGLMEETTRQIVKKIFLGDERFVENISAIFNRRSFIYEI